MVSDVAFYIVLALLIVTFAMLVVAGIFIKNQLQNPLLSGVMMTLHAAIFGYESALVDLIGPRGYRTHVFPQIVANIRNIEKTSPEYAELLQSKNVYEAMTKWMDILMKSRIVKNGSVVQNDDGTYSIKIPYCLLCHPIHDLIGNQKGICPMALILTAIGSIADNSKEPTIEYSNFSPTGTVTTVKFT